MKFLFAFAAIMAVASGAPQFLTRELGTVVEGPKTIIAGPSGTISADTGSIVKSGITSDLVVPTVLASRHIAPVATRFVESPLLNRGLYTPELFDHGLYTPELYNRGLYTPEHYNRGLYTPELYGERRVIF